MILALDYGEKRIGVAATDETGKYAVSLEFIPNKSEVKKLFSKDFPKGTPVDVINHTRKAAKQESKVEFRKICNKILYLVNCYYPEKIIVGLPTTVDIDGKITEGKQAKVVRNFIKRLEACFKQNSISVDVEFIDESLTSHLAEQRLREQGYSSSKIKELIDSESARIMLETYLKL